MATDSNAGSLNRLGAAIFGAGLTAGSRRNILSGYVQAAISISLTLISYPLYLTALGREQFSLWIIVASVINMNNVGTFGLSTALLKRTAELHAREDFEGIEKAFSHSLAMVLLLSLIVVSGVLLCSDALLSFIGLSGPQALIAKGWLIWMCVLIPVSYLVDQVQSVAAGLGRYDLANASQVLQQVAVILGAIIGFLLGFRYHVLPAAMLIAFTLQLAALVVIVFRLMPHPLRWQSPTDMAMHRSLLGLGGQAAASSLIELSFHMFNRVLVARYLGLLQVPVYEIAFNSSMRLRGAIAAGFKSLLPDAAKIASPDDPDGARLRSVVNSLTLRLVAVSAAIWLSSMLAGKWIFSLWLGEAVGVPVHTAFLFLVLGALLNACTIPVFYTLLGIGRFRLMVEASAIHSVVNLCLFFSLLESGIVSPNPAVLSATGALLASALWILISGYRAGVVATPRSLVGEAC